MVSRREQTVSLVSGDTLPPLRESVHAPNGQDFQNYGNLHRHAAGGAVQEPPPKDGEKVRELHQHPREAARTALPNHSHYADPGWPRWSRNTLTVGPGDDRANAGTAVAVPHSSVDEGEEKEFAVCSAALGGDRGTVAQRIVEMRVVAWLIGEIIVTTQLRPKYARWIPHKHWRDQPLSGKIGELSFQFPI